MAGVYWNNQSVPYDLSQIQGLDETQIVSIDANDGYTYFKGALEELDQSNPGISIFYHRVSRGLTPAAAQSSGGSGGGSDPDNTPGGDFDSSNISQE